MKTKFRWQPELAFSLIYWSLTGFLFFFSWIMALENTKPYPTSLLVTGISLFFCYLGYRRKMILTDTQLVITYARFWKKTVVPLETIEKITLNGSHLIIESHQMTWEGRLRKTERRRLLEFLQSNLSIKE